MVGKLRRAEIVKVGVATDSLPMGSLILLGNEDEEEREQRVHVILLINQTDLSRSWDQLSSSCYVFGLLSVHNQQLHAHINMVLEVISKANTYIVGARYHKYFQKPPRDSIF